MPSVEPFVQKLGSEAVNNVATLNQICDNYIGVWKLGNTGSDVPANVEFLPYKNNHFDSRANVVDRRRQVAETDILPGGKYRSIVKLFLRYTTQKASDPWTIGTGWLIAPDLIVTAGHYAFDWSYKQGRLTQVKAYIGYNGKASVDDPQFAAQFRQGGHVATPSEWLRSKGMKAYDVAFIKVHQPFTGIVPINFEDTPRTAFANIGLVGYAGDITDPFSGEKGAHMYEVFQNTEWNLEKSDYTMVEYALDPYGGNSGSPLFRQDGLVSIGTHVQGGNPGLASAIGSLGNPYTIYVATLSTDLKSPSQQGPQTDVPVRFVRIKKPNQNHQTTYNEAGSVDHYQSKDNTYNQQSQVNSRDQSNGVSYQTQSNSSDYRQTSDASNSRVSGPDYQPKDITFNTQARDLDQQPRSNAYNTQASSSDYQPKNNASPAQASSSDYQPKSNAPPAQASSSDYQLKSNDSTAQGSSSDYQLKSNYFPAHGSSSDYQPKSNAFPAQGRSSDYQSKSNAATAQVTSSDYQPKSNAATAQVSSSDHQPKSNVFYSQASSSDNQSKSNASATQTSSSENQQKSNAFSTQAVTYDKGISQTAHPSNAEFFEILKLGIKLSDPVLNDILHVYSPIVLGSIGSPLGALAGAILASAGKLAATHSAPIHDFRQGLPYDGVLERAILGEAAFTVVMSMKRRKLEELGIFTDMAEIVNKMAPITNQLAPFIMHILTAPALRVALHALHDDWGHSRSRPEVTVPGHESPFAQPYTPSTTTLEPQVDTFLKRLLAHCIGDDDSKGSLSTIDRIIQVGFREAGPVLTTISHEGLEYLTSTLPDFGVQGPGIPSRKPYIVGLPERAMLGEAALQALIKVPKQKLDERAFDIMAQTIDSIGGIVLQLAPGLIEDVGFLIKALVVVPLIGAGGIEGDNTSSNVDAGGIEDDNVSSDPNGVAGGASQASANRRAKGRSYFNLEEEFLTYSRDNNLKPMPSIIES